MVDISKCARRFYSNILPSGNAKLGDFSVFNNNLYFYNGSSWLLVANFGSVFPVGGDLFGVASNAEVIGIRTMPVSNVAPLAGEGLIYDGAEYVPTAISNDPNVGGDLSGTASNATVIGIQNISVSNSPPSNNQALIYNGSQYVPTSIASGLVPEPMTGIGWTTVQSGTGTDNIME